MRSRACALDLARTSVDRDEAVRELETLCGGRRVAVVRARQQVLSSPKVRKEPATGRAVELLDELLGRLPAWRRSRWIPSIPIAGAPAPSKRIENVGYTLVAVGYAVMTLGILEVGGLFNVVVGLAGVGRARVDVRRGRGGGSR